MMSSHLWAIILCIPPSKWMLCTKFDCFTQKTLNSGSHLSEWVLLHNGSEEVQKCRSCWPPCPRGWLRSAGKKGGPPITNICIDICILKQIVFSFIFLLKNFALKGSRFLSLGVLTAAHTQHSVADRLYILCCRGGEGEQLGLESPTRKLFSYLCQTK